MYSSKKDVDVRGLWQKRQVIVAVFTATLTSAAKLAPLDPKKLNHL